MTRFLTRTQPLESQEGFLKEADRIGMYLSALLPFLLFLV